MFIHRRTVRLLAFLFGLAPLVLAGTTVRAQEPAQTPHAFMVDGRMAPLISIELAIGFCTPQSA
jgi:hypothetical protein